MNAADGGIAQQSISRKYLHDEVAGRLRALIQAGELKPQERLNEGKLAARFGISRTPLREAIKILATEGLLDLLPNRGARVAIISNSEIEEMAEVIAGLEATAGELACRVGTDAEIAQILDLHEHMKQAYKAEDAPLYFDYNRQIHEAIMAASHNNTLQSIYATLSGRVQRARYAAHKTPGQWKKAMADHEQMVKLLRKRDGEALGRLLREHVRSKKAVIAATFRED